MLLEVAIDSLPDALAAAEAGADRLEVCDRLNLGGLTPPMELVRDLASRTKVPLFVMIRPRGGDFVYSEEEFRIMERQIDEAKGAGAHGFVFGLLTADAAMDLHRTEQLLRRAVPVPVTVHRAFDRCADLVALADRLAGLGVTRILTSGGQVSAEAGLGALRELQKKVGERIGILAGGGVRPSNIVRLLERTGVKEIHSAARDEGGIFDPTIVKRMKHEVENWCEKGER